MARGIKAQITLEYIATVLILFCFFVVFMIYLSGEYGDYVSKESYERGQDLIDSIKIELDTAEKMPPGYSRSIILPNNLMGRDYSLTIRSMTYNSELTMRAGEDEHVLVIPKVSGNFTKGRNTITRDSGGIHIT